MACRWNNKTGKLCNGCMLAIHTLYPYFLGLMYGARFDYNCQGDCQVACPGVEGVEMVVRKRPNDGTFKGVPDEWREVIYAEIIKVGDCEYGYKVGDKILFPLFAKDKNVCPSLFHTILPILIATEGMELPSCVNKEYIRCTDWKEEVYWTC